MYLDKISLNNQNYMNIKSNDVVGKNPNVSNKISFSGNLDNDIAEFSTTNQLRKEKRNIFERLQVGFLRLTGAFPQRNQYPCNIEFKEAKTLEEAIEFGQKTFGIKKYKGFEEKDLDVVNWINEGLVKCSNASKGNIAMPKKVEFKQLDAASAAISGGSTLYVDKKESNLYKELALLQTGNKMTIKEARNWTNDILSQLNEDFPTYVSEFSTIAHEMGHLQHMSNIEDLFGTLGVLSDNTLKNIKIIRYFCADKYAEEMQETFEKSQNIALKVSPYAATSPLEFVAECYAKMVDGIKLDDDVMQLYIKLGGIVL